MNTLTFFFIFIFYFFNKTVYGWWDITHMTTGAIAESQLTQQHVDKLNGYLKAWEFNYPGMSSIIFSTTFPDHVRCTDIKYDCAGLDFSDAFTILNHVHSTQVLHNPENLPTDHLNQPTKVIGSGSGILYFMNAVKKHVDLMSEATCTQKACAEQIGSDMSWNMLLRFYLHLFGDLHMPCHVGSGVSSGFPDSDNGCSSIPMGSPVSADFGIPESGKDSFHQFMDGVAYTRYGRWPNFSEDEIRLFANEYIQKYPYNDSTYSQSELEMDEWNFEEIAKESYDVFLQIYDITKVSELAAGEKLYLSQEVIDQLIPIFERRIALAGYRLGKALKYYAESLPEVGADIYSSLNPRYLTMPPQSNPPNFQPLDPIDGCPQPYCPTPICPAPSCPTPSCPAPSCPAPSCPTPVCHNNGSVSSGSDTTTLIILSVIILVLAATTAMSSYSLIRLSGEKKV